MAYRSDLTFDYISSPRIITVDSPSTELTMQDLYDTIMVEDAKLVHGDDKGLVLGSGKENLGGGTKVGITLTLQNAKVAFEARPGADWVLCSLIGGNLVAVDDLGADMDARQPTAFVTIDRTSSASATLQEQDALQYASYGGVVSVDTTSSNTGIDYPTGNMQYPVNNLGDAVDIAVDKGFAILSVRGDITITDSVDIDGYIVEGQNPTLTNIIVEPSASVYECEFRDAKISGTLDGHSEITSCIIDGLNYVSGRIKRCGLTGEPIILGDSAQALMIDCWSEVPGDNTPMIDAGGSGQSLAVRGHKGGFKLINRTGTDAVSIDFESGQFVADSTITDGVVYVRGTVGKLTINCDESLIDTYGVTNPRTIAETTWEYVI